MNRRFLKSFKEWCIENNKIKYIDLWDYDLNEKSPDDVACTDSINKYYFKCECGKHNSYLKGINNLINSKDLVCLECNSFYEWCVNNSPELLNYIDDSMAQDIHYISKHSGRKISFIIDGIKYSSTCSNITSDGNSPLRNYYNSVGYYLKSEYGDNAIDLYWSDKNSISPYYYERGSSRKIWIKCQNKSYHDDYKTSCNSFTNGTRCPWCSSKKIHPDDSFAQYNINRYGEDWIERCWLSDNQVDPYKISPRTPKIKVHIRCMNVDYHDFWIDVSGYTARDNVCPYCKRKLLHKNDSFGGRHPEIIPLWSDKNTEDPYSVAEFSHKKYWFKCENNIHEDYQRSLSKCFRKPNMIFQCPQCAITNTISSYEQCIINYFSNKSYTLLRENNCTLKPINPKTGYYLRYDNEVKELSLIIEVNGKQHYDSDAAFYLSQVWKTNYTKEEYFAYSKWKDKYKKEYAIQHGYNYLELPYYVFENNEYIKILNETINNLSINSNNQNP